MTYARPLPRPMLEEYIEYLSAKYPKCFFVDLRMRRPLKKTIVADLQKEKVLDDEKIAAVTNFYMNDFGYQYALLPGAERVDLDGNKAGTVTAQERIDAINRVKAIKQKLSERDKDIGLPVAVMSRLHAAGRIPRDALGKVTAPRDATPMKKPEPPKAATPEPASLLERLQALMASLQNIKTEDEGLKLALTAATLGVIVAEAQKLIETLGRDPCSRLNCPEASRR